MSTRLRSYKIFKYAERSKRDIASTIGIEYFNFLQ